jgi:O-antigen/teichoic acid export membrane protein
VLFPLFAKEYFNNPSHVADMLYKGLIYIMILMTPIALFLAYFSHEWLDVWLGKDFSGYSAEVAVLLLAGVFLNSFAQILFAYVQATGRADLTAKLHLTEVIPYFILLWFLLMNYGLKGAAIAWLVRSAVDSIGLVYLVAITNVVNMNAIIRPFLWCVLILVGLTAPIYLNEFSIRLLGLLLLFSIYFTITLYILRKDKILALIGQVISKVSNKK